MLNLKILLTKIYMYACIFIDIFNGCWSTFWIIKVVSFHIYKNMYVM